MNNDLISRQQLLEYLAKEEKMIQDDAERFGINKDVVEGMKQNINAVIDYVKEADVAYDVENVIEQLKEQSIEIVKQGCVSDDVCECRLLKGYNFLHKTSCGDVFEMENGFKFCPYCGKKIKIVGG